MLPSLGWDLGAGCTLVAHRLPLHPHRFCVPLVLAALPTMAAGEAFPPALQDAWGDFWLFRFFVNAAGYASIVVPGFLLIQYFKRRNYLETGRGICFPVIKSCVFGSEVKSVHPDDGSLPPRAEPTESSTARQVLKLLFCAAGLQVGALRVCMAILLREGELDSGFVPPAP